ncbi:MAG TPA: cupin domain-containing protein [Thermoleophilaceae bacterium]|nr:cupin domain-containing protein [Thermoleophilaceae bacterium]
MRSWDLHDLDVEAHKPAILSSEEAARVIVLNVPEGERLQEHRVHERAWALVLEGEVEIEAGETVSGGAGLLAELDPGERHELRATTDSKVLLFLAPWPGEGHPGALTLDEKANVRERARDRAS